MRQPARRYGHVLLGALAFGVSLVVVAVPARQDVFWLALLWIAWVATLVWVSTRHTFSLAVAAFTAATLLFVILPATSAVLSGITTIAGNDYTAGTVSALRIAALAQISLFAGFAFARLVQPRHSLLRLQPRLSAARLDRASSIAVATGILGVGLFAVVAGANLRDFFVFTTAKGYGSFSMSAAGSKIGYFTALQLVPGLSLVLIVLRFTSTTSRIRTVSLALALASTFLLLGGGGRGKFFVPVLAAGLVWFKTTSHRIGGRRLGLIGLIVMLSISALVGVARGSAGHRRLTVDGLLHAQFGSGSDLFAPLAGLAETIPSQVPYLNGSTYLEVLVFPIPRAFWSGKPEGGIVSITRRMDPSNSGLAFPEFGEMYANFGLFGVVLGSFALGLLIEWMWLRLARTSSLKEAVLLSLSLAVLVQIFVRGDIAPMLAEFAGLMVGALLICRPSSRVLDEICLPTQNTGASKLSKHPTPSGIAG